MSYRGIPVYPSSFQFTCVRVVEQLWTSLVDSHPTTSTTQADPLQIAHRSSSLSRLRGAPSHPHMAQLDRYRNSGWTHHHRDAPPGRPPLAIMALHLVWFGALLPGLWWTKGFRRSSVWPVLRTLDLRPSRTSPASESGGTCSSPVSSALHTAAVVLSVICASKIKKACDHWVALAASAGVLALLFFGARALFVTSFQMGWTWGFDWAYYFSTASRWARENMGVSLPCLSLSNLPPHLYFVSALKSITPSTPRLPQRQSQSLFSF